MKQKIELEYTINSSPKVIYSRLSTPGGLSEWFADDVNQLGKTFTFIWEGVANQAEMVLKKENKYIRFKWRDDEEEDGERTFFEFRLNQDELTGDVALMITDFADEDELDSTTELWNSQISELKHSIGL